jgi:Flp pilus assembly protein TadG
MQNQTVNIRRMLSSRTLFNQGGATAVEFALLAGVLVTLVLGIFEMGRVFFYMNTAAEATSTGARMAVVCDMNDPEIKTKMAAMLPIITNPATQINISYLPAGCNIGTCTSVTVSIAAGSVPITTYIPYLPLALTLPAFPTTLRRESMNSYGTSNPVCN